MATHSPDHGIDAVANFLDGRGIPYDVLEHGLTYTAAAEARAAGFDRESTAKTVVLRDADGFRLAVIPASERLDLGRAREQLGAEHELRLASEDAMAEAFPAFEVGAMPPLGPMLPAPEIIDRRLLEHDQILCCGGDHRHSLRLSPQDLVDVAGARVADICAD